MASDKNLFRFQDKALVKCLYRPVILYPHNGPEFLYLCFGYIDRCFHYTPIHTFGTRRCRKGTIIVVITSILRQQDRGVNRNTTHHVFFIYLSGAVIPDSLNQIIRCPLLHEYAHDSNFIIFVLMNQVQLHIIELALHRMLTRCVKMELDKFKCFSVYHNSASRLTVNLNGMAIIDY